MHSRTIDVGMVDGPRGRYYSDSGVCIPSLWIEETILIFVLTLRTKKIKYLEENVGALDVELTAEEVKEIREATEAAEPAGERCMAGSVSSHSLALDIVILEC